MPASRGLGAVGRGLGGWERRKAGEHAAARLAWSLLHRHTLFGLLACVGGHVYVPPPRHACAQLHAYMLASAATTHPCCTMMIRPGATPRLRPTPLRPCCVRPPQVEVVTGGSRGRQLAEELAGLKGLLAAAEAEAGTAREESYQLAAEADKVRGLCGAWGGRVGAAGLLSCWPAPTYQCASVGWGAMAGGSCVCASPQPCKPADGG